MEESKIVSEASGISKDWVTIRVFISREMNAKILYSGIHLYTLTCGKKPVI